MQMNRPLHCSRRWEPFVGKPHVGQSLVTGNGILGQMLSDHETDEGVLKLGGEGLLVATDEGIAPAPKIGILLSPCNSGSRCQFERLLDDVVEQMRFFGKVFVTFDAKRTQVTYAAQVVALSHHMVEAADNHFLEKTVFLPIFLGVRSLLSWSCS